MSRQRPLALTLGEPSGIGPDITAMAWRHFSTSNGVPFFLIGDATYAEHRAKAIGIAMPVVRIETPQEAKSALINGLPVIDRPLNGQPRPGTLTLDSAGAVIASIDTAVTWALQGEISGIVTNPIQKETLYAAGFTHQGHTDYLAHLARMQGHAAEPVMMLAAKDLRTIPVTVHIPLKDVPASLSVEAIEKQARVAARDLKRYFGIDRPRIGIVGLNPHAGEGGAMGSEEATIIMPAIGNLLAEEFDVTGPLPGDTAFHEEARARFDVIVCMYHDQALIPVKTLDFHGGVNVTLGLPFIRTSPDHGTALPLAGTGKANPRSLIAAIEMAAAMAARHAG